MGYFGIGHCKRHLDAAFIITITINLIAPHPETRIVIPHEYTARALLAETEARFHSCLEQISNHRCRIQIKPRLADVFLHSKGDVAGFNMISQKHVDFLICRNDDWMPILGIELDDDSPKKTARKQRDMFMNELFASTGIPLLRIHVREVNQVEKLIHTLTQAWYHRWTTLAHHQAAILKLKNPVTSRGH